MREESPKATVAGAGAGQTKEGGASTSGPSPPSILNEKEAQCIAAGRDVTDYLP